MNTYSPNDERRFDAKRDSRMLFIPIYYSLLVASEFLSYIVYWWLFVLLVAILFLSYIVYWWLED